jgi:hypothetical protein
MAINLWWEHTVDAYLLACAEGRDWRAAVAAAEQSKGPRRVLTRKDLRAEKGIKYSRQHLAKKIRGGGFPPPFTADPRWARPGETAQFDSKALIDRQTAAP